MVSVRINKKITEQHFVSGDHSLSKEKHARSSTLALCMRREKE